MNKLLGWLVLSMTMAGTVWGGSYDPLAVDPKFTAQIVDLSFRDAARERDLPVRLYLPATTSAAPVVLFSHGTGGDRKGSAFLGKQWAARGYVAVFLQHPGSDDSLWRGKSFADRMSSMHNAINVKNFALRAEDVPAVLDQLTKWNADSTNSLHGRMDLSEIGMSGHSFGAVTTQAVSGQTLPGEGQNLTDKRIRAAIPFSPSSSRSMAPEESFADVHIPWLLMTGTKDVAPIGNTDMKSRLAVYPALKGAPKYELVLWNAEHSVFTETVLPGDKEPRNPNHHRVIMALSTAFWDAYLRHDAAALEWLNGSGPRTVLEEKDAWQLKAH